MVIKNCQAMRHLNVQVPDRHRDKMETLQSQTGLTLSELMRRMFDYCLQPQVLNMLVPCMSGQMQTGR